MAHTVCKPSLGFPRGKKRLWVFGAPHPTTGLLFRGIKRAEAHLSTGKYQQ